MGSLHPKIVNCINEMMCNMVLKLYYYGEFAQFINFQESINIERIGVTVNTNGMICYWNRNFVNSIPQKQLNFIIVHEIFHLLYNHPKRTKRGGYEHELSNIVQDMIINQAIYSDLIDTKQPTKDFFEIPTENDEIWVYMIPKEYKGQHIFEDIYDWIIKERKKYNEWKTTVQ
jgi:predicted metal-dependent peptidase